MNFTAPYYALYRITRDGLEFVDSTTERGKDFTAWIDEVSYRTDCDGERYAVVGLVTGTIVAQYKIEKTYKIVRTNMQV